MKLDAVLAFESAAWPVLMLGPDGRVAWSNAAALKVFGDVLKRSSPPLASIWSPENKIGPDHFLNESEPALSAGLTLSFLGQGAVPIICLVFASIFKNEQQRFVLLQ